MERLISADNDVDFGSFIQKSVIVFDLINDQFGFFLFLLGLNLCPLKADLWQKYYFVHQTYPVLYFQEQLFYLLDLVLVQ